MLPPTAQGPGYGQHTFAPPPTGLAPTSTLDRFLQRIAGEKALMIVQRLEAMELVLSFETRNKYEVRTEDGSLVAWAAEQSRGALAAIARQFVGHWRSFDVHLFDAVRQQIAVAHHPFRWFFNRLEISHTDGRPIGALQRRFAVLGKRFDLLDASGRTIATVDSPLWKPWTFPFVSGSAPMATITKKWGNLLTEGFTDKDRFRLEFHDPNLDGNARVLLVLAAVFVDLIYFERKA